ncbi:unnamed protein product [Onchocerca ochengi]|uniref:Uncharacterized protein n=1 Tax=Onchocerca ochengi TaxID=42157 RepID=A0A182E3D1_ONCOC|nr:unnamed protein product [Onchocerca ochengi]
MLREFIIFVGILVVANCQNCCFNCYCPNRAGIPTNGRSPPFYYLVPKYGFNGFGYPGFADFTGLGGLGASYGPAVNGLCPVGINIDGQCYATRGVSPFPGWQTWPSYLELILSVKV